MANKPKYIVVEGPIGVGKSTLAEMLAAKLDARMVMENVEENPFLHDYYGNIKQRAFQTQVFFLLSRWKQQQELFQPDLFHENTVSDYLFEKDRLFAELTLSAAELKLYNRLYEHVVNEEAPVQPDLVVYLYASVERLIERVNKRGKKYESSMTPHYLEGVVNAYNNYFFSYRETPLLMVNTEQIDFVEQAEDFVELYEKIQSIKGGVHHFSPQTNLPLRPRKND